MIRDFVAIFGVLAGFSYYVLTVRNAQKTQQLQLLKELDISGVDMESAKIFLELTKMEWTDYDDFEKKYGSDNNPDNYAKRLVVWNKIDYIGRLLKAGLIKRELVFTHFHTTPLIAWKKFGDVIKEIRRRYNEPFAWNDFEYLAEECFRYWKEKGIDLNVPDTYFSYIPDN